MSRRRLLLGAGGCVGAGVLGLGSRARAALEPGVDEQLAQIEQLSASLCSGAIDGLDWQREVQALLAAADASKLRAALSVDWATMQAEAKAEGRVERRLELDELRGTPSAPHFRRKLFVLRTHHAIVPHGHRGIASVFVVLDGRFRGRHFDRLRDEPEAILIRPSDDRSFAPGDCAAISDQVDNVHWFTSLDDRAVLLNFSVTLPPSRRIDGGSSGRMYLDPDGELLDAGVIRAPRVTVSALRAKYDGTGL